jgi:putative heme-binding domain-containing protein
LASWLSGCVVWGAVLVASAGEAGFALPHWTSTGPASSGKGPPLAGRIAKEWTIAGPVRSATLQFAADYCRATLLLNGRPVLRLEPFSPLAARDVAHFLRSGANEIAIDIENACGPAAVAACVSIDTGGESPLQIVTDQSWRETSSGEASRSLGHVPPEFWGWGRRPATIDAFDNYEQWRQATTAAAVSQTADFWVAPGFELSLLRTAGSDEGSWVSLAFDPRGRLTVAREDQGLLRMTLATDGRSVAAVETINSDLLECRGLLYAHNALYANANNSKGLYRLRDADEDDRLEEVKLLREFPGGVGHGRNDLALGPDGLIYSIHGDSVDVPTSNVVDRTSPLREARRGQKTSEGYLVRTDGDGQKWEVLCGGLRNPFGIAFNPRGDAFTYDADAEFDMGAPWYRPTRVVQLLSGADFGWRGITGQWPPYNPDHAAAAPPSLDIGKGSPTAVAFGTGSKFPAPYQDALFILDWAYGRVLAVHQTPRGAGYRSSAETFLKGRPLNVTDLTFGPDGALYLCTGGRKTQSALYRVAYTASAAPPAQTSPHEQACREQATRARALRAELEAFHGPPNPAAVAIAWPHLDAADPVIRHAARIAIECQPVDQWREKALSEDRPTAAPESLLALAQTADAPYGRIAERLLTFGPTEFSYEQLFTLLNVYSICLDRAPGLKAELGARIAAQLSPCFDPETRVPTYFGPANSGDDIARELARLLVDLQLPGVVETVTTTLLVNERQEDRLQALFILRNAKAGWTNETRRAYFTALNEAGDFVGGDGMPRFLASIREEASATLTAAEQMELADVLKPPTVISPDLTLPARPLVKAWTLEDFRAALAENSPAGDADRGAAIFREALCVHCHRVGARGPAVGPDLTHVASRFSRQDILESILTPSQVVAENYRNVQVLTTDGRALVGRVLNEGDYRSETLKLSIDPLRPSQVVQLSKREIERSQVSPTSPMPQGLLDSFSAAEILDLLAYLQRP